MEFTVHAPPPQLADAVKAIWCARGTKHEFDAPESIVPDGCVEIIFNLPSMSGAEIAAACGYSDQAHLIRECKRLSGRTPQRLKTTQRSLAGLMSDRHHQP